MNRKNLLFAFHSISSSFVRLATGVITLVMLPLYLPLLGQDAFGLYGVFMSLTIFMGILEGGLGNILVRDLALIQAKGEDVYKHLRSFEFFYLVFGIIQTLGLVTAIQLGAFDFIKSDTLDQQTIRNCLLLVSFAFFSGGAQVAHDALITARNQIFVSNAVRVIYSLLSSIGAYAVLVKTDGSPEAFFAFWAFTGFFMMLVKLMICWHRNYSNFFREKVSFVLLKKYLKEQWKLVIDSGLSFFSTQYIHWIVISFFSLSTVGLFTLSIKVADTVVGVLLAVNRPLVTRYSMDQVGGNNRGGVIEFMVYVISATGMATIGFYFLNGEWMLDHWLDDKEFKVKEVFLVSSLLLISAILQKLSYPLETILRADRKFKLINIKRCVLIIMALILMWCVMYGLPIEKLLLTNVVFLVIIEFAFMVPMFKKVLPYKEVKKLGFIFTLSLFGAMIQYSMFKYATNFQDITLFLISGVISAIFIVGIILKSRRPMRGNANA